MSDWLIGSFRFHMKMATLSQARAWVTWLENMELASGFWRTVSSISDCLCHGLGAPLRRACLALRIDPPMQSNTTLKSVSHGSMPEIQKPCMRPAMKSGDPLWRDPTSQSFGSWKSPAGAPHLMRSSIRMLDEGWPYYHHWECKTATVGEQNDDGVPSETRFGAIWWRAASSSEEWANSWRALKANQAHPGVPFRESTSSFTRSKRGFTRKQFHQNGFRQKFPQ